VARDEATTKFREIAKAGIERANVMLPYQARGVKALGLFAWDR
jgi:hypothetical protein